MNSRTDIRVDRSGARRRSRIALVLVTLAALLIGSEVMIPSPQARAGRGWRAAARRTRRPPPRRVHRVPRRKSPVVARPVVRPARPSPTGSPAPEKPAPLAALSLTEIVLDPADPGASFAVIDGVACRPGDRIRGWVVHAVEPDAVRLGETGRDRLVVEPSEKE